MKNGPRIASLRQAAKLEAANLIKAIASPVRAGEPIKRQIERTAQLLGWPVSRVEDIWRERARRIEAFEMDILRSYTTKK